MRYYGFKSIAKFPRSNLKNLGFAANGMSQVIKSLFANNEQGFAFDFNDLSTMYQDSAGTIPVTGVGQPVGKVLDKSGRGNHATQSTSAKRPILQKNATTGAYYLAFDGVDDFLATDNVDFSSSDKVSLFVGLRKIGTNLYSKVCNFGFDIQNNVGAFEIQAPSNDSRNYAFAVNANTSLIVTRSTMNYPSPHSAIFTAVTQIGVGTTLRVNNNAFINNTVGTGKFGVYQLGVGGRPSAVQCFNGELYSLISIARLTTTTETTNTEKVIAKNVGVTL